ncbi:hypothetical protein Tco_0475835 [Tanacetum coccineum]
MTNYRLYHASKEDLIGGMKTPWIRSGRQGVKDHKRNHDSDDDDEDDDDDEGPSAGSNQDTNIRCTLPREVSTTTWFKPIPESERPATPEPEWTIPPKRLPKTEHNLANTYATRLKFRRKTSFKGRRMILVRSSNCSANEQERRSTAKQFRRTTELSTLTLALEELVPSMWVESEREYDISAVNASLTGGLGGRNSISTNTVSPLIVKQSDLRYEFSVQSLDQMVKDFHLFEYNKGMETRKWSEDDKRRSKDFITAIEKRLQIRRILTKVILRVLRIILVILPEHPSETIVFHNEDGNPARANIKQALGYLKDGDGDGNSQPHKGVKASANSDVMYSFTSAQDGDPLQDDVRLCLGDDLKKAQDHSQRQA